MNEWISSSSSSFLEWLQSPVLPLALISSCSLLFNAFLFPLPTRLYTFRRRHCLWDSPLSPPKQMAARLQGVQLMNFFFLLKTHLFSDFQLVSLSSGLFQLPLKLRQQLRMEDSNRKTGAVSHHHLGATLPEGHCQTALNLQNHFPPRLQVLGPRLL